MSDPADVAPPAHVTQPPGITPPAARSRIRLSAGTLAAVFGLLGTLIGGAVTYVGNRELQDQQISQQNAAQALASRTAAKLLLADYDQTSSSLQKMVSENVFITQPPIPAPPSLSSESLVIARVRPDQLSVLSQATLDIASVIQALRGHQDGEPLVPGVPTILDAANQDIQLAIRVVKPIAEG